MDAAEAQIQQTDPFRLLELNIEPELSAASLNFSWIRAIVLFSFRGSDSHIRFKGQNSLDFSGLVQISVAE
jgi:hypothetical protein